jgi:hypothetical protein
MRFIVVNGRSPFRRFSCANCGEAIVNSYLREITTHLYYCDQSCYFEHCKSAPKTLAHRTKAALVGLAPVYSKRLAKDELTVSS